MRHGWKLHLLRREQKNKRRLPPRKDDAIFQLTTTPTCGTQLKSLISAADNQRMPEISEIPRGFLLVFL